MSKNREPRPGHYRDAAGRTVWTEGQGWYEFVPFEGVVRLVAPEWPLVPLIPAPSPRARLMLLEIQYEEFAIFDDLMVEDHGTAAWDAVWNRLSDHYRYARDCAFALLGCGDLTNLSPEDLERFSPEALL